MSWPHSWLRYRSRLFSDAPWTQWLQHCGDLAFMLTHSFADLYGSLQKEPRVCMDSCDFPLLPACGTCSGLKKVWWSCVWELWFVSSLCHAYSFWYYKVDPSGKDFLWQDKENWCSPHIVWWTGQGEGIEKREKNTEKRKNKQPDKQLPLVLISLASIDLPGSCSERSLLQHYTLLGCSSLLMVQWSHTKQGPLLHGAVPWCLPAIGECASWGCQMLNVLSGVYCLQSWAVRWFERTVSVHISCISD